MKLIVKITLLMSIIFMACETETELVEIPDSIIQNIADQAATKAANAAANAVASTVDEAAETAV